MENRIHNTLLGQGIRNNRAKNHDNQSRLWRNRSIFAKIHDRKMLSKMSKATQNNNLNEQTALFTNHSVLVESGEHEDDFSLLLPNHPPEVLNGRLHRALAGYVELVLPLWPLKTHSYINNLHNTWTMVKIMQDTSQK